MTDLPRRRAGSHFPVLPCPSGRECGGGALTQDRAYAGPPAANDAVPLTATLCK